MLTDTHLKGLKPRDKLYKVADALGLYVTITPTGVKSFRYDYRLDGRRETLVVGRYEDGTPSRRADDIEALDFGATMSLTDAHVLRDRARRMVADGISPSKGKVTERAEVATDRTFGTWAGRYFAFKVDLKSGGRAAGGVDP